MQDEDCRDDAAGGGGWKSVNNVQLVVFRILFGLLMAVESFGAIATGWVRRTFVDVQMTFPVWVVGWPRPLPGYGMYGWFIAMGVVALMVMMGWRYRWTATLLAVFWTEAYLSQKTNYNNHYYLAVLVCWAMVLLPAHRRASMDAARTQNSNDVCPAWIITAFKLQLAIVFVYAAIAKLTAGWLSGDYITHMFQHRVDRPLVGPLLGQAWFQTLITYSGIAFDALVIPMLWWRPTRMLAFFGLVVFNLFNSLVFQIGIFPYMVLAWTVFFFEPRAVERVFRWVPGLGRSADVPKVLPAVPYVRAVLVAYFVAQVLLPVRHHLIRGDVDWTEEGHRMSWRMMVHSKGGTVTLIARDPKTGKRWTIDQSQWLTKKQRRRIATKPDILYQFIQRLKADFEARGLEDIEIFARSSAVSLNGGPSAPLYDPNIDLAKVSYHPFGRSPWVVDRPKSR